MSRLRQWLRRGRPEPYEVDPALEREYAALMADLRAAGIELRELMDLGAGVPDPAVPILHGWLPRAANDDLANEILTYLSTTRPTPELLDTLLDEYGRLDRSESYRWQVGDALEQSKDPSIGARLLPIATDPRQGQARQMGLIALGRTRLPAARDPLIALLGDAQVAGHAAEALGHLGDPAAIPALERMSDERDWVRGEAAKAIARLRRRTGQ